MGGGDVESGAGAGSGGSHVGAVLAALGVGVCPLCFGFTVGFTSPTLPAMTAEGGALTLSQASTFTAAASLGGSVGSVVGGRLADSHGRKRTLVLAMLPCLLGFLAVAGGRSYAQLVAGRLLCGVAIGAVSVAAPLYLAEVSPPTLRGALCSLMQLSIVLGLLLVYVLGYILVPTHGWRFLAALGAALPATFVLALAPLLPESPAWLASSPHPDRVHGSLQCLRGSCGGGASAAAAVEAEAAALLRGAKAAQGKGAGGGQPQVGGAAQVLRTALPRALGGGGEGSGAARVACAIMLLQQYSGINAVNMFAGTILADGGVDDPQEAAIWLALTHCVSTPICMLTSDRCGRRALLGLSAAGMALAASGLAFCTTAPPPPPAPPQCSGGTTVALLVAYIFSFGIGVGPLPFVIVSEILPQRTRAAGQSLATCLNWLSAFTVRSSSAPSQWEGLTLGCCAQVTRSFEPLAAAVGEGRVFGCFAALCGGLALFAYQAVPETRGKSLAEIAAFFDS